MDHKNKFLISLRVNGKSMKFEVDSGAADTVVSESDSARHFPGATIQNTDLQLISYCGRMLRSKGFITVSVRYKNVTKRLNIYVVGGNRRPLMGREWIRQLTDGRDFLDCYASINHIGENFQNKLHPLLVKYNKLQLSESSAIKGIQARLTLKPSTTPVFVRARPVLFKLLPLIERELDSLEQAGITEKVATSKWATPIVPILKKKR